VQLCENAVLDKNKLPSGEFSTCVAAIESVLDIISVDRALIAVSGTATHPLTSKENKNKRRIACFLWFIKATCSRMPESVSH
jgi:hypothetical protein